VRRLGIHYWRHSLGDDHVVITLLQLQVGPECVVLQLPVHTHMWAGCYCVRQPAVTSFVPSPHKHPCHAAVAVLLALGSGDRLI
jgi:hypothetical protein